MLTAEASDADGQIRDVEFFVADSDRFDATFKSVGKRTSAPFEVTIQLPETEHRIVTVLATDDKGEWSDASTHAVSGAHHAAR